mmetsp:Transcript_27822/g.82938  ORF Transcript_27822/g.82938 Transcript_27822/m.82938 type:complete len:484 (-) Transcript_27822:284-1735(-)
MEGAHVHHQLHAVQGLQQVVLPHALLGGEEALLGLLLVALLQLRAAELVEQLHARLDIGRVLWVLRLQRRQRLAGSGQVSCRTVRHVVAADLAEEAADVHEQHHLLLHGGVCRLELGAEVLLTGFDDPGLQVLRARGVHHVEVQLLRLPDNLHDHFLVLGVGGLRLPHVKVRQGLPHLVDPESAAEVLDEILLLSGRHRHRDLAVLVLVHHARVELEVAPNPLDVVRVPPRRHQRHDAADAGDAVAEGLPELLKGDGFLPSLRLLHAVLVDAQAADPRVYPLGVQVPLLAVLLEAAGDVADGVAPGVAQHDRCQPHVVYARDAVDVGGAHLLIPLRYAPRADHVLALWPDDRGLDLVHLGVPGEVLTVFAHRRLGLRDDVHRPVVHAHGAELVADVLLERRGRPLFLLNGADLLRGPLPRCRPPDGIRVALLRVAVALLSVVLGFDPGHRGRDLLLRRFCGEDHRQKGLVGDPSAAGGILDRV